MTANTDQDLVERTKRGESAAVAELYRRYWRAARAAAYGVTADLTLAEDAASEAFLVALEGLQGLKDTQRFGPWLRTIAIRTAKRRKTIMSRDSGLGAEMLPGDRSEGPGARLERRELGALIHEAVSNLSETLREAICLFYFEGYSLKEAAHFLDVPEGTLKRRLHDGRKHLRDAAERILKGRRSMNVEREKILRQLTEAVNEGIHSEAFFQAARQALRLRPVPEELLKKAIQKHWGQKRAKMPMPSEKERKVREAIGGIYGPSPRALDPNDPVGAAANAIRAALPEFVSWQVDWSEFDVSKMIQNISDGDEKALSFTRPPGFVESLSGSYISAIRTAFIQDEDGSVCTLYEFMQKKETLEAVMRQMRRGKRLSDTLSLLWKESGALELRSVEQLLRRLSEAIAPATPAHFQSYDDPRHRAALRMRLGDNPMPAATGGVLNSLPGLPDGFSGASVQIFLEPWATARTGQPVELVEFPSLDFLRKDKPGT